MWEHDSLTSFHRVVGCAEESGHRTAHNAIAARRCTVSHITELVGYVRTRSWLDASFSDVFNPGMWWAQFWVFVYEWMHLSLYPDHVKTAVVANPLDVSWKAKILLAYNEQMETFMTDVLLVPTAGFISHLTTNTKQCESCVCKCVSVCKGVSKQCDTGVYIKPVFDTRCIHIHITSV